ncbi:MAG: hypothetical protein ABL879_10340 [Devosia sp.]
MSLLSLTTKALLNGAALAVVAAWTAFAAPGAISAEAIYAPGQPIITGFPGALPADTVPDGADPLDYTFIDLEGQSLAIQSLDPDGPPDGQLLDTTDVFGATARDVGLVFGVTLDNADETSGALAPNIYVSASSAFGLNIVVPDADGNSMRSRTGAPEASFAPGQWGSADGAEGYPGSIWKIDGTTGEVTLLTTVVNSGAGLGSLVFEPSTQQFFVSDLDTGLIYRLAEDGTIIDTFDHGVTGRPMHELEAVEDDGIQADITDAAFNTEDPTTWGFTQAERRVDGLAANNGRIYYWVAGQIWSVRLNEDGSFGTARWELDVGDPASGNNVTSIVFDRQGRMILAQRGATIGAYDYTTLAEAETSAVVRYEREFPDDPETPSTWVEEPDSYAIGLASSGFAASGGVAMGYGYDTTVGDFSGVIGATLWASGDSLRYNPDIEPPVEGPMHVHGLQGTLRTLVRPLNEPPTEAVFTDYDGNTDDETSAETGHVGAVAIWQDPGSGSASLPDVEPPYVFTPGDEDDEDDYELSAEVNLSLEKWSSPHTCFDGPTDYWCTYTIRVENTGTLPYWGPVTVQDHLPANPAGAVMTFWPTPQWNCLPAGPAAQTCATGPVLLFPGDAVVLHETVQLPKPTAPGLCNLVNVAGIQFPFWWHDADSSDDFDGAVAHVPAPGCVPPGGVTDLTLNKFTFPSNCFDPGGGADYLCIYGILVTNTGPGNYTGPIQVKDTLGVNVTANVFGAWTCGQTGPVLTCDINSAPVNVPPGWSSVFFVQAPMPKPVAPPACDLDNKAQIAIPLGGSPTNILPGNDFDTATTHILSPACLAPAVDTDIEVQKTADYCSWFIVYYCQWTITITNIGADNYLGPLNVTDQAIGATYNDLDSAMGGGCTGTPDNLTCDYPIAWLPPGVPFPFTFYTAYDTSPSLCSASNSITVDNPNPGSVQNPAGNDSVSVGQAIPNPACAGLPVLNITKTATGCADDPGSTYWLCDFDIKVENLGPVSQPGPIVVRDFNGKPTTFSTAACGPLAPNFWECTRAASIGPGASWSFSATTHVDPNGVTIADCAVDNIAWIDAPGSLSDPGHWAEDSQKVPQLFINLGPGPVYVYCDPPSLKLEKTVVKTVKSGDGYNTTFQIKAISTGPDPYMGTVEVDDLLPDGTSYVSSDWTCVPTTGNDVHCSSPYKNMPVGKYTATNIVVHTSAEEARRNKCSITNVVEASISAEVLHSAEGVQYTASATAELPGVACGESPQCDAKQQKPNGECCPAGEVWNGKQCAPPKPICADDSHINSAGKCVCDKGTEGKPGQCKPIVEEPTCPDDSHLNSAGKCVCDKGTEGKPGQCEPIVDEPVCPRDSHLNDAGKCVCDKGTEGKPGQCKPIVDEPSCPKDSHLNDNGKCVCDRGTEGKPGQCEPIEEAPQCPDDSHLNNRGQCVCGKGTEGRPGRCEPIVVEEPQCPDDSRLNNRGQCVCARGTEGQPGQCKPIVDNPEPEPSQCPDDSFYDKRQKVCVCLKGTVGEPGNCVPLLTLQMTPLIN